MGHCRVACSAGQDRHRGWRMGRKLSAGWFGRRRRAGNSRRASASGGKEDGSRFGRTKEGVCLGPGIPPTDAVAGRRRKATSHAGPPPPSLWSEGAWRRSRPTLWKLEQSARGPGKSPFLEGPAMPVHRIEAHVPGSRGVDGPGQAVRVGGQYRCISVAVKKDRGFMRGVVCLDSVPKTCGA